MRFVTEVVSGAVSRPAAVRDFYGTTAAYEADAWLHGQCCFSFGDLPII